MDHFGSFVMAYSSREARRDCTDSCHGGMWFCT